MLGGYNNGINFFMRRLLNISLTLPEKKCTQVYYTYYFVIWIDCLNIITKLKYPITLMFLSYYYPKLFFLLAYYILSNRIFFFIYQSTFKIYMQHIFMMCCKRIFYIRQNILRAFLNYTHRFLTRNTIICIIVFIIQKRTLKSKYQFIHKFTKYISVNILLFQWKILKFANLYPDTELLREPKTHNIITRINSVCSMSE